MGQSRREATNWVGFGGTNGSEANLKAAADECQKIGPGVGVLGRAVGEVDAQSRGDVDDDAEEEQGSHSHAFEEWHVHLEHNKGGQESAEEVGQSVDNARDREVYVDVEALVRVRWIGVPERLERTIGLSKLSFTQLLKLFKNTGKRRKTRRQT